MAQGTAKNIFEGQAERVIYHDQKTGYTVVKCREKKNNNAVTLVGSLPNIVPGETIRAKGKWKKHKQYGKQFEVKQCKTLSLSPEKQIEAYLGSGLFPGIGPGLAKKITDQFGTDIFHILNKTPQNLLEIPGITESRLKTVVEAWQQQRPQKDTMLFLCGNGVTLGYAKKIYNTYKNNAVEVVKNNPYQLALDVNGIGFLIADQIAQKLKIDPNSPLRLAEAVIHVLNEAKREGHVFYPQDKLIGRAADLTDVESSLIAQTLEPLEQANRIVIEGKAVYLTAHYIAETNLAHCLLALQNQNSDACPINNDTVKQLETKFNIELAEKQIEAIKKAVSEKVLVITGGPGTGKTTIVKAILETLKHTRSRTVLTAPTGRAAKRLQEVTGYPATTIHRLLKYSKGRFTYNKNKQLKTDAVIVDEASMIDLPLMYALTQAVPSTSKLIIIGDANQLPSVGAGNVLSDLIESETIPTVCLDQVFRQNQDSQIIVNAHRVNTGEFPRTQNKKEGDFFFVKREKPSEIADQIVNLCTERLPATYNLDPKRDIQVLSFANKGEAGVRQLNKRLQKKLNPNSKGITVGDKVMQVSNNYDKEVYNGDIGEVVALNGGNIDVKYEEKTVSYEPSEHRQLTLAYAITVHKSQGSEFPVVILPVTTQQYILLQRKILYTGITRGKRMVILVGTPKATFIAVKNNKSQKRFSRLKERLQEGVRNVSV